MPPKAPMDENLVFLYHCLKNSDFTKPNINALATIYNIKPNAAQMRFYRLKASLETTIAGSTGTTSNGGNTQASVKINGNNDDGNKGAKDKAKTPRKKAAPAADGTDGKGQGQGQKKRKRAKKNDDDGGNGHDGDGDGDGDLEEEQVVKTEEDDLQQEEC